MAHLAKILKVNFSPDEKTNSQLSSPASEVRAFPHSGCIAARVGGGARQESSAQQSSFLIFETAAKVDFLNQAHVIYDTLSLNYFLSYYL